jgi:choline dehydrogenase-like flavoprotein
MKNSISPDNPQEKLWDIIIIGTGMGGATIGYALAKAGKSVLFCEKGKSNLTGRASLTADYAENFFPRPEVPQLKHGDILARAGRWQEEIEDASGSRTVRFIPFIGSGTGGSTALFGMAMERFFPADFAPKRNFPDDNDSTLPTQWPITYGELLPYYKAAEELYRVRGEGDPLRLGESCDHLMPPPRFTPASQELYVFFLGKGLHPYRLPLACEFVPGCDCCQGYICDRKCKNDSAHVCLQPALTEFGAELLDECEILKLEATRSEVTGVVCNHRGHQLMLRGAVVILAANALATPGILLNSSSPVWPDGLANDSGLVGRNLMRHYVDLYVIRPKTKQEFSAALKEVAFNDLYVSGGQKFGTVQSFGALPPASMVVEGLEKELREGRIPLIGLFFAPIKPVVRFLLDKIFSRKIILATIMEDLPYRDNRVTLSERTDETGRRKVVLRYQLGEHDRKRISAFRKELSKVIRPYRFMLIRQAENNERIAHACGTCRFGVDPLESVLDPQNRAHGIKNLYVVDSSFFPSSGGTNPALTIAANALRVADHILSTWEK